MNLRTAVHLGGAAVAAAVLIALATSSNTRHSPAHRAQYVQVRSLTLRYVRAGRGTPVVLIHGYGESMMAWRAVFDLLAAHHDVLALDLPGFGLSSKPAEGYETDSIARDVLRALQTIGIGPAVLVGHSLGGAVAFAATLQGPGRIRALALVDPALVGTPAPVSEMKQSDRDGGSASSAIAEYEALRTRFTAPHDPQWLAESDSALAYVPADDPAYRVAVAAVLREFDFAYLTDQRAAALTLPTLVLWGEYDEVFPVESGRRLAARLTNARFLVIPRSWHRPHVERPAETADAVLRFVAALDSARNRGSH